MAKTISELKAQSAEVKNASAIGENTATRVGQLFGDIVEHVEQYENTKNNKDASQDAEMQSLVNAEASRAKGEERGLQNQIHAEEIDRKTTDTYLANLIQQESSARETADENIRTALANETARAQAAEQELAAAQIYTAKIKDGAVTTPKIADGAVTYEKTDIIAQELGTNITKVPSQKVVTDAIQKEETERKADINGLAAALASETINREQGDENLNAAIEAEAEARDNAINNEAQARSKNDALLNQAIVAEKDRAEAREQELTVAIQQETERAEAREQELTVAIQQETDRAEAREQELTVAIQQETTRATAAEEANAQAIAEEKAAIMGTDILLSKYCCDKQNLELASIEDGKYWTSYSEKSAHGSYRCCSVDVTSYRGKKIMIKVGYNNNPCAYSFAQSGELSSRIIETVKDAAIILISDADTELHLSWNTTHVGLVPIVAVIDDSETLLHSLQTSVAINSEHIDGNSKQILDIKAQLSEQTEITWDESRNGMYLNSDGTLHEPATTTRTWRVSADIPVSYTDIFKLNLHAYGSYEFMLYDNTDSVIAFHKGEKDNPYEATVNISDYADKNPSYIRFASMTEDTWKYVSRIEFVENYINGIKATANEAVATANEVYNTINDHTKTIVDLVNTYDGIGKYWSAPDTLSSHGSYAYISIIPETLIPEYIGKYIYLRVGYTSDVAAYSYVKYEDGTFVALTSLVTKVYINNLSYAKLLVTEDIARIDLSWDMRLSGTQTVFDFIQGQMSTLDNRVTILENSLITTPLTGKKIFLFGDSISSADYNWYKDYLAKYTGATVYNQGAAGRNVQYQASNLYFDRLASIKPDIIVALLGGNDSGSSGSVGTFDENSELGKLGETLQAESDITADYVVSGTAGTSGVVYQSDKFIVGLSHIFRKWRAEYYNYRLSANLNATLFKAQSGTEPQEIYSGTEAECIKYAKDNNYALAPIGQYYVKCTETEEDKRAKLIGISMPKFYICTTLPQKRYNNSNQFSNPENWERKRLACIEVAEKYNIPCIDLAKEFAIDWDAEPYWPGNGYSGTSKTDNQGIYTMDGLHPNEFGYEWIARIVSSHLK